MNAVRAEIRRHQRQGTRERGAQAQTATIPLLSALLIIAIGFLFFGFDVFAIFCLFYPWWDTTSVHSRLTEIQKSRLSSGKLIGWFPTAAAMQRGKVQGPN